MFYLKYNYLCVLTMTRPGKSYWLWRVVVCD